MKKRNVLFSKYTSEKERKRLISITHFLKVVKNNEILKTTHFIKHAKGKKKKTGLRQLKGSVKIQVALKL